MRVGQRETAVGRAASATTRKLWVLSAFVLVGLELNLIGCSSRTSLQFAEPSARWQDVDAENRSSVVLAVMPTDGLPRILAWAVAAPGAAPAAPANPNAPAAAPATFVAPAAADDPISDRVLFEHLDDAPLIAVRKPEDPAVAEPVRNAPRAALKLYMDARSHFQNRRFKEAVEALEECRRIDPQASQAELLLARLYLLGGDRKRARERLESAVASSPDDFDTRYFLGKLLFEGREYSAAREQLQAALAARSNTDELGPRVAQAWYYLGRCLQEDKKWDDAVRAYRGFLGAIERGVRATTGEDFDLFRLTRNPVPLFQSLATCLRSGGHDEKAVRALADAVSMNPTDRSVVGDLVDLLVKLDRKDAAIGVGIDYVESLPTNQKQAGLDYLESVAKRAGRQGSEFLAVLEEIVRRKPTDGPVARLLVERLRGLGRDEDARRVLDSFRAPPAAPVDAVMEAAENAARIGQNAEALLKLAVGLTASGRSDDEAAKLEAVIEKLMTGDPKKSALAERITALAAADATAKLAELYLQARLSAADGKFTEAIGLLNRVVEARPKLLTLVLRIADLSEAVAQASNNAEEKQQWLGVALTTCQRSLDAGSKSPELHARAGRLEWTLALVDFFLGERDTLTARLERAERHLQQALSTRPKDLASRKLLVEVLLAQQNNAAAIETATVAVKDAPADAEATVGLMRALSRGRKPDQAVTAADEFLARQPAPKPSDAVAVNRAKAKAYMVMYEPTAAAEALTKAIELSTDPAERRALRLELCQRISLAGFVYDTYARQSARDGGLPGPLLMADRYEEAATVMSELVAEMSKNPTGMPGSDERRAWERQLREHSYTVVRLLVAAEKVPAAAKELSAIPIDETGVGVEHLSLRILVAGKAKDAEALGKAIEKLRRAIPEDEEFKKQIAERELPEALLVDMQVGRVLADAEQYDEAERVLRERINRTDEPLQKLMVQETLLRVMFGENRRDMDAAAKLLNEMIAGIPDLAAKYMGVNASKLESDFLQQLGGVHIRAKKYNEAIEALEKAFRLTPDDIGLHNDLGYTWADHGRKLAEARKMIERAVEADPFNAAYRDSLGWVLYKVGDFKGAKENLLKATDAFEGADPVLWDHLGDTLWKLGEKQAARDAWTRSASLFKTGRRKDPVEETRVRAKLEAAANMGEPMTAPIGEAKPNEAKPNEAKPNE